MLPNLAQLSPTGAEKRARGGGGSGGGGSEFPQDVVEYLAELADLRRPDQVLIVFRGSGEDGECDGDTYATLTFAELEKTATPAAKALLHAFRTRLATAREDETVDYWLADDDMGGLSGLADLLTDQHWPHATMDEDYLNGMAHGDHDDMADEDGKYEALVAVNKPLFELNREFLAKALADRAAWERKQDWLLPIDIEEFDWESNDVEAKWESILTFFNDQDEEDYEYARYTPNDIVPLEKWRRLDQVNIQSLMPWAKLVYRGATRLLQKKQEKATPGLPFWVPRIRIYIVPQN